MQDKHELLIRLEHLYSRIQSKRAPEKEEMCELLEMLELIIFDVYEELERLKELEKFTASRCGLMQRAICAREDV